MNNANIESNIDNKTLTNAKNENDDKIEKSLILPKELFLYL